MELYQKTCKNPHCNKEFMGARTQQYCCPDCRSTTRKNIPKKACTIDEIVRKAKANGMSYGKYVAMLYETERKNKL